MKDVCILGGTGFVGRHLTARLVAEGWNVTVPSRWPERHRDMLVLPTLRLVGLDVFDGDSLKRTFAGCDAVINLVGILNERGHRGKGFARAHVELAEKVLAACRGAKVTRLLHMSALNADTEGPSHYLRSKGLAAAKVMAANGLRVTVFEPSVIFGPGDSFLNRFATLLARLPLVFPLACPEAKFAPVYVGDVVDAFRVCLGEDSTIGQRYSLGGPRVYTLRELVAYTARLTGRRRWILGLPGWAAWLQAAAMEWVPGKPFSLDNYRSLSVDSVCTDNGLQTLAITPTPLEAVAPQYLAPHRGYDAARRVHS